MPFQLVVIKGRSASQALKIPADAVTTVGRQQGCQIRISSSQVSRKHCEFFEKDGHLLIKDLGSSNGTYINGTKIQGEQRVLEPGAVVLIGGVSFRVQPAGAPINAAASPTPEAAAAPRKPSDTAVAEAVAVSGEDEIELDFEVNDEDMTITAPIPDEDMTITAPIPESEPAAQPAMSDDAVAEYLLNIDLDDDDKV